MLPPSARGLQATGLLHGGATRRADKGRSHPLCHPWSPVDRTQEGWSHDVLITTLAGPSGPETDTAPSEDANISFLLCVR